MGIFDWGNPTVNSNFGYNGFLDNGGQAQLLKNYLYNKYGITDPNSIDWMSDQGNQIASDLSSTAVRLGLGNDYNISYSNGGVNLGGFAKLFNGMGGNNSNSPTFLGGLNVALQGLGQLGNLYGGMQQLKLARQQLQDNRDAFEFNKNAAITNQHNAVNAQRAAYDAQSRARYSQEGLSGSALDNAIAERAKNLNLNYL